MNRGEADRRKAIALYEDGLRAFRAGDRDASKRLNEDALELARASGDLQAEALALVGLSRVAFRDGDYGRARALAAEALELAKSLDEDAEASPLHMLAAATRLAGEYDEARLLYRESIELNRRLGASDWATMELHNLGFVELHRGEVEEAERLFGEAAKLERDEPYDLAMRDLQRAALSVSHGQAQEGANLLTRVESRLEGAGIVLDPDDGFEVEWLRGKLGGALRDRGG